MQLSCPNCSARDADVSKGPGLIGAIKALFGVYKLRCRRCKTKWETSAEWRYARCPRCYRQDLTSWSPQDYRLGPWTTWLLRFGATRYRCAPCRCNFASFRPPKDRLAWEQRLARARGIPAGDNPDAEKPEEVAVPEVTRARVNAPASRASLTAPAMRRPPEEKAFDVKAVKNKPGAVKSNGKPAEAKPVSVVAVQKPLDLKPAPIAPAPEPAEPKPVPVAAAAKPIEEKPLAAAPKPVEPKPVAAAATPKLAEVRPAAAAPKPVEPKPAPAPVYSAPRSDAEIRASLNGGATVGRTVLIKGKIVSGEDLTIDGEVEGSVEILKHCLRVDSNGKVSARVNAHDVIVLGTIHGDVETTDRLDIRKGANVLGDIKAHRLLIEEGACVKGKVSTGSRVVTSVVTSD